MSYAYKKIKLKTGKTIDEHRLIVETLLGRKLLRSEHVHNKDGNKKNNAIENLEVLSRDEHARSHMTGNIPSEATKGKLRSALTGLRPGELCSSSILKDQEVLQIKVLLREGS